jgi:glycosyltransferase involved in cell wall biosynthesis
MRILYITTKATYGGVQTHIVQCATYMRSQGDTVAVMSASSGGDMESLLQKEGIPFFSNRFLKNSFSPFYGIGAIRKIRKVIRDFKPDVVSCHSTIAGLWGRLATPNNIICIFTAHGWIFTDGVSTVKRYIGIVVEKFLAYLSDKIICVSEYDRQLAIKYHIASANKAITIHNGVEVPAVEPPKKENIRNIIFVGRLVRQKNPLALLKALTLIPQELKKKLTVRFVGAGYLKDILVDFCAKHDLQDIVSWCGNKTRSETVALVKESDLFILPTNYEGMPRSILEALSFGVPVLATGVGGVPELVDDTVGRVLTKGHEPQEIAKELCYLSEHSDVLMKKSEAAYQRIKEGFQLETMQIKTRKAYEECLNVSV